MAISTVHTYLGFAKITDSTEPTEYTKLTDIKDYSDLASPPEAIPTTTMSDVAETSIPGVIKSDQITFTTNFVPEDYAKIAKMAADREQVAVCMLYQDNSLFKNKGIFFITVTGASVDEVVNATVTLTTSSGDGWVLAGSWDGNGTNWTQEKWKYTDSTKKITKISP